MMNEKRVDVIHVKLTILVMFCVVSWLALDIQGITFIIWAFL